MKEIRAQIEIEAPVERVWEVLADFISYPEWNPFIVGIQGAPKEGGRLSVTIRPPGRKGMTFRPNVLAVRPERELRWLGHLFFPGVFDGEHVHELEQLSPGRTRYIQREQFRGVLVPFMKGMLTDTERGFEAMAAALKSRTEGSVT